jgi:hypothetical protein
MLLPKWITSAGARLALRGFHAVRGYLITLTNLSTRSSPPVFFQSLSGEEMLE